MNLFSKIFGDSDNKDNQQTAIQWNELTDLKQLDELVSESFSKPVFIFKHSTRCSISRMALKNFEKYYSVENASANFLDLLSYRNISNEIADWFGVIHQSPQLILLIDGKCAYTVSHSDIDAEELKVRIGEHIK